MSEIDEFQHPDPIWTWKSNKRGGLHEGFRVGLADLLIGLPRTAVPADRGLQLSEGRNRDAPDVERVLAAAFHELRQREKIAYPMRRSPRSMATMWSNSTSPSGSGYDRLSTTGVVGVARDREREGRAPDRRRQVPPHLSQRHVAVRHARDRRQRTASTAQQSFLFPISRGQVGPQRRADGVAGGARHGKEDEAVPKRDDHPVPLHSQE